MSTRFARFPLPVALPTLLLSALIASGPTLPQAVACGGFFCAGVPIFQAGEQIIFRQDGNRIKAIVLIQYQGDAEDFSWVLPVPGIPDISLASDLLFTPLELATRPQFTLDVIGEPCQPVSIPGVVFLTGGAQPSAALGDDSNIEVVQILERLIVGPFDIQIVTSADAEALATWLDENGYDLSDRGRDLIAPYVEAGMNFVAMRLKQESGTGDIQPIQLEYESDDPMIPIRLTAVAAQPDMGIAVWLLGNSRAVPLNYLHVIVNYTRLNWLGGAFAAYNSYLSLITEAMDEAGGQGFATDFAAPADAIVASLPDVATLRDSLALFNADPDPARAISTLAAGFLFPRTKVLEILRRILPLPSDQNDFTYQNPPFLHTLFDLATLTAARNALVAELEVTGIQPLEDSLAIFDDNPYLTRFYTTLSPEEMTLDPVFSFNPDLPDQSLERKADLVISCFLGVTNWFLRLGPGTDRDGEIVMQGTGIPPSAIPPEVGGQAAIKTSQILRRTGSPETVRENFFIQAFIADPAGSPLCGLLSFPMLLATLALVAFMRRRF